MSEEMFQKLGKDAAIEWFRENEAAGNQVGDELRMVTNDASGDVPIDQLVQADNAEEAIMTGLLELPGYWGDEGEGPPGEE